MPRRTVHTSVTLEVVMDSCDRRSTGLDNPGFCLSCGEEADGCEPDARGYVCDSCDCPHVWGAEEILLSGMYY